MRRFMPPEHRALIAHIESLPSIRELVTRDAFNNALEALATFREIHLDLARRYIARWVADPRGMGGTPYLHWLGSGN
jgi:indoleamine 2,3-dioxygenase